MPAPTTSPRRSNVGSPPGSTAGSELPSGDSNCSRRRSRRRSARRPSARDAPPSRSRPFADRSLPPPIRRCPRWPQRSRQDATSSTRRCASAWTSRSTRLSSGSARSGPRCRTSSAPRRRSEPEADRLRGRRGDRRAAPQCRAGALRASRRHRRSPRGRTVRVSDDVDSRVEHRLGEAVQRVEAESRKTRTELTEVPRRPPPPRSTVGCR